MTSIQIASNPFAQMMDPQAVIAAVERSERLQALHSRVCRPLDRPLMPVEAGGDAASFDASVDAAADAVVDSVADASVDAGSDAEAGEASVAK